MKRRSFLGIVCVAPGAPVRAAVSRATIHRVGYLHPTDAHDVAYVAFRTALERAGYVIGANTILEERFAEGDMPRLPALAAELVAKRVDVIVAVSPTAIRAARAATRTIPIVMAFSGDDPVTSGFAATLARPGGNTTGLTTVALDMAPKWIELLADLRPGLEAIAVLRAPRRPDHDAQIAVMRAAAQSQGIRLDAAEVSSVEQYARAFDGLVDAGCEGIVVLAGPEFTHNRVRLVELVNAHRLPSVYQFSDFVLVGGLASYGPGIADLSARAVAYVDKILNGANPAELPIEQPRRLFLVLNRKTANALGIAIPPRILLQADEIIQ
ncbi:MAG TPA: ABC transporter substrate-binding protein [Casimicrobiaceae bacterium]|nr:ABC transporter substrate-binding protein [Casimicrobiaceae bacterium]